MGRVKEPPQKLLAQWIYGRWEDWEPGPEEIDAALVAVYSLPPRWRVVMLLRSGLYDGRAYKLREIGKILGLSGARVGQISLEAERRSRRYLIKLGNIRNRSTDTIEFLASLRESLIPEDDGELDQERPRLVGEDPSGWEPARSRVSWEPETARRVQISGYWLQISKPLKDAWTQYDWVATEVSAVGYGLRLTPADPQPELVGTGDYWRGWRGQDVEMKEWRNRPPTVRSLKTRIIGPRERRTMNIRFLERQHEWPLQAMNGFSSDVPEQIRYTMEPEGSLTITIGMAE